MTRQERLAYCRICFHKKPNSKTGLLCGLTNQKADFETECADFSKDEQAELHFLAKQLEETGDYTTGDALDYKKNQNRGGLFFFLGIVLTLCSYGISMEIGSFYFIFTGMVVYGARQYIRGVEQEKVWHEYLNKKKAS